ncbi:MAG: hypothetical protein FWH04_05900 [Oscillospiraceae bacterium]|nr:hypothetical protein [Oscillospiraceae bacterium]
MVKLNRRIADALCTAITIGFLMDNNDGKSGSKTKFIYEDGAREHTNLLDLLKEYRVEGTSITPQTSKAEQPFIWANSRGGFSKIETGGFASELKTLVGRLEEEINKVDSGGLHGAYIGGIADIATKKLNLLVPSLLWQRSRNTHMSNDEPSNATVSSSYESSRAISQVLIDELKGYRAAKGGIILESRSIDRIRAFGDLPKKLTSNALFASVHGLITAMTDAPPINSNSVNVELALGKDTCKIAACIPCSLFASSQNAPASATHLGRGDNWNFPENFGIGSRGIYASWEKTIGDMYYKGMGAGLVGDKIRAIPEFIALVEKDKSMIPQIFLDSLTFEGKFTKRIADTLQG